MAVEPENEAIKALGSLFKLTQVYLWDDDFVEQAEVSSSFANKNFHHLALEEIELSQQMKEFGLPVSFVTSKKESVLTKAKRKGGISEPKPGYGGISIFIGLEEVTEEPVRDVVPCTLEDGILGNSENDFLQSSLETIASHLHAKVEDTDKSNDGVIFKDKDGEVVSPINFHDKASVSLSCISTLVRNEPSYSDVAEEVCIPHFSCNGGSIDMEEDHGEMTGMMESYGADCYYVPCLIMSNGNTEGGVSPINEDGGNSVQNVMQGSFVDKQLVGHRTSEDSLVGYYCDSDSECIDITTEEPCIPDSSIYSQCSITTDLILKEEYDNCKPCGEYGDWRTFWDAFYMRTYFYNTKTHESTWDPPPGVDFVSFSEEEPQPSDMIVDAADKGIISGSPSAEVLDPCDLQDKSHLFQEATSSNNSSGNLTHVTSSRIEPDASNEICGKDTIFNSLRAEVLCPCDLQDKSQLFQDATSSDNSLGHASPESSSRVEPDTGNVTPGILTSITNVSEEAKDIQLGYIAPAIDELERQQDPVPSKNKKKKLRRARMRSRQYDYKAEFHFEEMPQEFPHGITKYWCQRYSLFSKFDDGIKMDEEGWFSVTPEPIARHHATRCGGGTVVDSFTGVGGNAIQLAKGIKVATLLGNHVIAVDIDPLRIGYAQHNAAIYGVDGNIDFIMGDFFQLAPKMKADTVFLSPPWGGPDYAKVQTYNIKTMLKPHDGYFLFNTSRGIASRIIMFLPRNVDLNQLAELCLSTDPPWKLEVEKNFLNGKLKAVTAYFSDTST
ncbi:hypothetical protein IFM89_025033 [Coptis chinensis]|uniref:Trimethylguanosine synthase n=1 Tax=Coptis chinensis TaxID=261450 RepID=A0A835HSY2_9MAGN|nr:hypothetical protein IFM89_025033 [Coptis chinensis]